MFPDVEECQIVGYGILLYEQADAVRWLLLQVTVPDVEDLVEETPYMEPEPDPVFWGDFFGIFPDFDPPSFGKGVRSCVR